MPRGFRLPFRSSSLQTSHPHSRCARTAKPAGRTIFQRTRSRGSREIHGCFVFPHFLFLLLFDLLALYARKEEKKKKNEGKKKRKSPCAVFENPSTRRKVGKIDPRDNGSRWKRAALSPVKESSGAIERSRNRSREVRSRSQRIASAARRAGASGRARRFKRRDLTSAVCCDFRSHRRRDETFMESLRRCVL